MNTRIQFEIFEHQVLINQLDQALDSLVVLLQSLESNYGTVAGISAIPDAEAVHANLEANFFTRFASAITALLTSRQLRLPHPIYVRISDLHRTLHGVFSATDFGNLDHMLRGLGDRVMSPESYAISANRLPMYCLGFGPDSRYPLLIDQVDQHYPELAIRLAFGILSTRICSTKHAEGNREQLLPWLSSKLDSITNLSTIPFNLIASVYMGCTYALGASRHDVKKSINRIVRMYLDSAGIAFPDPQRPPLGSKKPTLVVVIDHPLSTLHAVYRILGPSIEGARSSFNVVGVFCCTFFEPKVGQIFDEVINITADIGPPAEIVRRVEAICRSKSAAILYMPSVGMGVTSIVLSNVRVAPIQILGIGHPATTHSSAMDYFVLEEDYVGDASIVSEKLLVVPRGAMPYCSSSAFVETRPPRLHKLVDGEHRTDIAVVGSLPKLNADFIEACKRIRDGSIGPIHFHFFALGAKGMYSAGLIRILRSAIGEEITVHFEQPYGVYIEALAKCDMFLSPFPFGNLNGGIDCVMAGLIGVCKNGPEIFERINAGLLKRLEFPSWLVAESFDDYVRSACRLVNNPQLRRELSEKYCRQGVEEVLYAGQKEALGRIFLKLLPTLSSPES